MQGVYLLPQVERVNILDRAGKRQRCPLPHTQTDWSPQDALVAVMIAISASDEDVRTVELITIEQIVDHLPVFADYNAERMKDVGEVVFDLFADEDGLDSLLELIVKSMPERLAETAYALACDVAASDGLLGSEELQLLAEFRYALNIDRLAAAAIERGARARHLTL